MKRNRSLLEAGSQLHAEIHLKDPSHSDHTRHIKKSRWISPTAVVNLRSDGDVFSEAADLGQQREGAPLSGGFEARQTSLPEAGPERDTCLDGTSKGRYRSTSSSTTERHHAFVELLVREQISRLADSEARVRVEAIQCVAAHIPLLKLNTSAAEDVHDAFVKQLWKEKDASVLEKLVFSMSLLAIIDAKRPEEGNNRCWVQSPQATRQQYMAAGRSPSGPMVMGGVSNSSENDSRKTEEIDLNKDRSSDLEMEGIDLNHNAQEFDRVTEKIPILDVLLQYLLTRRQHMSDTVKLQLLRSLYHLAVNSSSLSWEVIALNITQELGSLNPRVRIWGMRLITETIKRTKVWKEGHGTANNLIGALEQYMQDTHPGVRETTIRSVMSLCSDGWNLTEGCYKHAVKCLEDDFETVRFAAVQLVGLWVKQLSPVAESGLQIKHVDAPFVQVCKRLTDMSYKVRQVACQTLGDMKCVSEAVLLQTLSKKVLNRDKEVASDPSVATPDSSVESAKGESASIHFDSTAAGAFVHGLDDEYFEVRAAAIEAMAKLSTGFKKMAAGAVELLVDMLNDDAANVRMQTMQGFLLLARAGQLAVQEEHLHMFLSVLEDCNAEMRRAVQNLLAAIELPSISTYQATVRALIAGLQNHPEDLTSTIQSLTSLGMTHGSQTECIADGLVDEMRSILNGDEGLDEPRYAAILALFISASRARPLILTFLPSHMLAHTDNYIHKLPEGLPIPQAWPLGSTSTQLTWFYQNELSLKPRVGEDKDASLPTQQMISSDKTKPAIGALTRDSSAQETGSVRACSVLDTVGRVVQTANEALLQLKSRGLRERLRIIRVCRNDLQCLVSREEDNKDAVKLAMLYVSCMSLAAQFHASLRAKSSTNGSNSLHHVCSRFETLVKRMQHCFTGQQRQMQLFMQELNLLVLVWKQASQSTLAAPDGWIAIDKEIRAAIATAEAGFTQEELQESHLFRAARELVPDTAAYPRVYSSKLRGAARGVALDCWPIMIVSYLATIREKQAEIRAPKGTCENPLPFSFGMPLAIQLDITLHNVSTSNMDRIWVQFALDNCAPQFTYLDTDTAIRTAERDNSTYTSREMDALCRRTSTVVQVGHMPSVEACVAKIGIIMECFSDLGRYTNRARRGPRKDSFLLPLSTLAEVHLSRYRVP